MASCSKISISALFSPKIGRFFRSEGLATLINFAMLFFFALFVYRQLLSLVRVALVVQLRPGLHLEEYLVHGGPRPGLAEPAHVHAAAEDAHAVARVQEVLGGRDQA